MNDRATFLAGSLADMQATIRAIDVKVAALIVCLLAPLQNIHRVFKHLVHFAEWSVAWPAYLVIGTFLTTWIIAFIALVRAIAAIGNPASHVRGSESANGAFFLPAQYKFWKVHVVRNPQSLLSKDALADIQNRLPSDSEVEAALVFEQMKLAYIRDLKLFRLDWGLKLSLLWLLLGILIYVGSKYAINDQPRAKAANPVPEICVPQCSLTYHTPSLYETLDTPECTPKDRVHWQLNDYPPKAPPN